MGAYSSAILSYNLLFQPTCVKLSPKCSDLFWIQLFQIVSKLSQGVLNVFQNETYTECVYASVWNTMEQFGTNILEKSLKQ